MEKQFKLFDVSTPLLPLPARNEWGEGEGEGRFLKTLLLLTNPRGEAREKASSPLPSPPEEERETTPQHGRFVGSTPEVSLPGILSPALSSMRWTE